MDGEALRRTQVHGYPEGAVVDAQATRSRLQMRGWKLVPQRAVS